MEAGREERGLVGEVAVKAAGACGRKERGVVIETLDP